MRSSTTAVSDADRGVPPTTGWCARREKKFLRGEGTWDSIVEGVGAWSFGEGSAARLWVEDECATWREAAAIVSYR